MNDVLNNVKVTRIVLDGCDINDNDIGYPFDINKHLIEHWNDGNSNKPIRYERTGLSRAERRKLRGEKWFEQKSKHD